mgnify:FL=1
MSNSCTVTNPFLNYDCNLLVVKSQLKNDWMDTKLQIKFVKIYSNMYNIKKLIVKFSVMI